MDGVVQEMRTYTLDMMGDVDEKKREVVCLVDGCLKEEVIEVWKGLMVGREEEKRGAAKADRAQVEVTMRGIDKSGAAMLAWALL